MAYLGTIVGGTKELVEVMLPKRVAIDGGVLTNEVEAGIASETV